MMNSIKYFFCVDLPRPTSQFQVPLANNRWLPTTGALRWSALVLILMIAVVNGGGTSATETHAEMTHQQAGSDDSQFHLTLEGGTYLVVQLLDQQFQWSDILPSGAVRARTVRFNEVKRLTIGSEGLSDQVLQVQRWLEELASEQYLSRENAEMELSNSTIAMRFRHLIEQFSAGDNFEVSYRIGRILESHRKAGNNPAVAFNAPASSFDQLELIDGTQLTGDCGQFNIECLFRGQSITLNRGMVVSLHRPSPAVAPGGTDPNWQRDWEELQQVTVYQRHQGDFYLPHQTLIDFESSQIVDELPLRFDVSTLYQNKGLLLRSERPGYIGISGYRFRSEFPPTGNSVCVFEAVGNAFQRFKGVMEIRFCSPGQPQIPAGVHEFGLFLSRIDNARDFIMEAYDWSGGLLGTVESSDTQTVFLGIKSPEPIAFLRILSNPYLFSIKRKIDEDFCADDFLFSYPLPLTAPPVNPYFLGDPENPGGSLVTLTDGNRVLGSLVSQPQGMAVSMDGLGGQLGQIAVKLDEIKSVRFLNRETPVPKGRRVWMAQLEDGSIFKIDPSQGFSSELFGGVKIPVSDLIALWLAPNKLRFPWGLPNRVDQRFPALVFPTCLVQLENFSWSENGFRWAESTKLEQDLWIRAAGEEDGNLRGPRHPDYEDPTPNLAEVNYDTTSIELVPTLWIREPKFRQSNAGHVRLTDGQMFILGGPRNFNILEFNAESITLGWDDRSQKFPMEMISSILLPQP